MDFPMLSSGHVAKYPLARKHKHRTMVVIFGDFSEQRWAKGVPLEEFDLRFTQVSTADKELVRHFFNGTRGQFDTTWSITITDTDGAGIEYDNMQFVDDNFTATQQAEDFWSFSLRVRQTRKN